MINKSPGHLVCPGSPGAHSVIQSVSSRSPRSDHTVKNQSTRQRDTESSEYAGDLSAARFGGERVPSGESLHSLWGERGKELVNGMVSPPADAFITFGWRLSRPLDVGSRQLVWMTSVERVSRRF